MKEVKILNTKVADISSSQLKEIVKDFLAGNNCRKIGKVNTEFLLRSLKSDEFCDALGSCDFNIADGKGVLWAAKYLKMPLINFPVLKQIQAFMQMIYSGAGLVFYPKYCREPICQNIPGLEVMYLMLEAAEETDSGVYFFGAEKEVLPKAIEKITEKFPELKIAGSHHGFDYDEELVSDINQSKAKLLIVALGSPKQEYWIRDHIENLENIRLAVGEGGTLDFVAGGSKRAPKIMQKLGLEWLWRLFTNVNRTGVPGQRSKSRIGRIWNAVPVFIYNVVKWKIGNS